MSSRAVKQHENPLLNRIDMSSLFFAYKRLLSIQSCKEYSLMALRFMGVIHLLLLCCIGKWTFKLHYNLYFMLACGSGTFWSRQLWLSAKGCFMSHLTNLVRTNCAQYHMTNLERSNS